MRAAWGDAFDYYIRGITEKYLMFRGRASRLEFWGFAVAAGIMWIPLYFVGEYAEMPLLPYYFSLATLLPTVAVTARRLHDINKNAALYLIPGAVLAASGFFIGLAGRGGTCIVLGNFAYPPVVAGNRPQRRLLRRAE